MTDEAVPDRPVPRWLHLGAVAAVCVAIFPLVLGMIVTSIRAGMADEKWPTEPWYLLTGEDRERYKVDFGYLIEHSHRIAGYLVGGVVSLLAVGMWWTTPNRAARWVGVLALVAL